MRVITRARIVEAKARHRQSAGALDAWYRLIKKGAYADFAELKKTFNSVDKVDKFYVFDIGGNKIRLIAAIHFNRQMVYIRFVLTHKEYDSNAWKRKEGVQ